MTSARAPTSHAHSRAALLSGTTIMCQCHGSRFDLRTGTVIDGPAIEGLTIYDVREADGSVQVRI